MDANDIYKELLNAYSKPHWWSDDPFTVMFQAVLVQNTAWSSVEKTCEPVKDKLSPQFIAGLSDEELQKLISPCGFYKSKSQTITSLAKWFEKYDYSVREAQKMPLKALRSELLSIKGIGAETADVILVYALYQPSFVMDAYTRRFLSRLGFDLADDTEIRKFLEAALPKDAQVYGYFHWLILDHCISVCRKTPLCGECKLNSHCAYFGGKAT